MVGTESPSRHRSPTYRGQKDGRTPDRSRSPTSLPVDGVQENPRVVADFGTTSLYVSFVNWSFFMGSSMALLAILCLFVRPINVFYGGG